jgi:uncharacterized protein DUF5684
MNLDNYRDHFMNRLLALSLVSLLIWPSISTAAIEQTFDVLQIGTHTYRNVTVTTKSKNYIFIMHSTGMENIKLTELPPDILRKLGYSAALETPATKRGPASFSTWMKQAMGKAHLPQAKQLEAQWRSNAPAGLATINLNGSFMLALCGCIVLLYLLSCYCGLLICQKTGNPAGALVWIPVLQLIPLLRAAGMSPAWLLAFLMPVLNIVAQIVWSLNIVKARGKSAWVAFFLVLPVTTIFAYLYLAFSNGAPKQERPVVEIMTLETA